MTETRTYTEVSHDGAVIWIDGRRWVIDSVDVIEGHPGCEDDAVAYLSPLPNTSSGGSGRDDD